jgi:hypothetical protein
MLFRHFNISADKESVEMLSSRGSMGEKNDASLKWMVTNVSKRSGCNNLLISMKL